MSFWSTPTADSEPKRNFRFLIQLTGFGPDDILWYAKSVVLPSYNVTNVAHAFLDNEYYYPGRVQWQDVSMVLVDPVTTDSTKLTNQLLIGAGYKVPGAVPGVAANGLAETISKVKMADTSIQTVVIQVLNAAGEAKETWTLKNPLLISAKFGNLDYSNDELKQVELSFKYDFATCENEAGIQFDAVGAPEES